MVIRIDSLKDILTIFLINSILLMMFLAIKKTKEIINYQNRGEKIEE